jgi:hypothetical protein
MVYYQLALKLCFPLTLFINIEVLMQNVFHSAMCKVYDANCEPIINESIHILLNPCSIVIFAFNTLVNQRDYFLSFQIPLYPLCFVMKLHIILWFIWHSRLRNFGFCEMNGCWTNQWNWELLSLQLYLLSPPLVLCVKFCLCVRLWTNVNDVWHFFFCITILHYFTLDFVQMLSIQKLSYDILCELLSSISCQATWFYAICWTMQNIIKLHDSPQCKWITHFHFLFFFSFFFIY